MRRLLRKGVGPALASLLVLAFISAVLNDQRAAAAAAHEAPLLLEFGAFFSRFGLSGYMLALSAAVAGGAILVLRHTEQPRTAFRARRLAERAVFVFTAIAASGLACQAIKHLVGRPRPRFLDTLGPFDFAGPTIRSGFESFPSGHSTTAFSAALALSLLAPAWGRVLFPAALVVCVSRVVAEAHYPSDTFAGALLGTLVTLGVARSFAERDIAFPSSERLRLTLPRVAGAAAEEPDTRAL